MRALKKEGLAVLNCDDEEVREMAEKVKSKKISYGFSEEADVQASDIFFGYEKTKDQRGGDISKIKGISFKLSYEGTTLPVRLDAISRTAANKCGAGGGGGRNSF